MLGASAAQVGTAYLFSSEARISPLHRQALHSTGEQGTALTNVLTGRHARGVMNRLMREVGPTADGVPEFPRAAAAIAPLRAVAEAGGSVDFSTLWGGQAAALGRELPAGQLTERLWAEAHASIKFVARQFAP